MFYSSGPEKGPIRGKYSSSTAAAVLHQVTAEEAEAGFVAAYVLAVWRCLLEESWLVKTAAVCQSVGSSLQTKDIQGSLRVLICCADFFRSVEVLHLGSM